MVLSYVVINMFHGIQIFPWSLRSAKIIKQFPFSCKSVFCIFNFSGLVELFWKYLLQFQFLLFCMYVLVCACEQECELVWWCKNIHMCGACVACRDSIGSCVVVDDTRWAGTHGIEADFYALTHCSVEFVSTEDIKVWTKYTMIRLWLYISTVAESLGICGVLKDRAKL